MPIRTELMSTLRAVTLLIAGGAALAGCSPKAPQQLPPAPEPTVASEVPPPPSFQGPVPGSQAEFVASMMGQDVIYFDTDKYNIDVADQASLAGQAQWLIKYPSKKATIEGHADERGTREYNLALGERRANSAKNYLVGLGVDAARLTTVSYGKERPIGLGSDEDSWTRNRRAVTVTID